MWGDISLLFCIYLMVNNVWHLVIYPLSAHISFLEKCLLSSSDHFKIGFFFFFAVSSTSSLYTHTHTHTHVYTWIFIFQIFSSIPLVVTSLWWLFLLLCRSSLVWCIPTYLFLIFGLMQSHLFILLLLCICCHIQKIIAKTSIKGREDLFCTVLLCILATSS